LADVGEDYIATFPVQDFVKNLAWLPATLYSRPMNTLALRALTGTTKKQTISMSITGIEIMRLPAEPGGS
jgi:hypothetical protein